MLLTVDAAWMLQSSGVARGRQAHERVRVDTGVRLVWNQHCKLLVGTNRRIMNMMRTQVRVASPAGARAS